MLLWDMKVSEEWHAAKLFILDWGWKLQSPGSLSKLKPEKQKETIRRFFIVKIYFCEKGWKRSPSKKVLPWKNFLCFSVKAIFLYLGMELSSTKPKIFFVFFQKKIIIFWGGKFQPQSQKARKKTWKNFWYFSQHIGIERKIKKSPIIHDDYWLNKK